MENTCAHCGQLYSKPPSQIGRFCSKTCGYAAMRKSDVNHRRIRRDNTHPLAGASGLVSEARAVLFDRIGWGPHPCHWCGRRVQWKIGASGNKTDALIADHLDNNPLNDASGNIVPACGTCNGTRTQSIKDDELFLVRPNGTRVRAVERTCLACGGKFLIAPASLGRPNRGLFCSLPCARAAPRRR